MRDQSRRITGTLADFGERMAAAQASQREYDQHVAPIVAWARASTRTRREAAELVRGLLYDDGTTDTAYDLLSRAYTVLR